MTIWLRRTATVFRASRRFLRLAVRINPFGEGSAADNSLFDQAHHLRPLPERVAMNVKNQGPYIRGYLNVTNASQKAPIASDWFQSRSQSASQIADRPINLLKTKAHMRVDLRTPPSPGARQTESLHRPVKIKAFRSRRRKGMISRKARLINLKILCLFSSSAKNFVLQTNAIWCALTTARLIVAHERPSQKSSRAQSAALHRLLVRLAHRSRYRRHRFGRKNISVNIVGFTPREP